MGAGVGLAAVQKPTGRGKAPRWAIPVKLGRNRPKKILSTHSLTWPEGRITLHAYPERGSHPARCALVLGGLLARCGAPLFGTSYECQDRFPEPSPTGKATDPWAFSRSASSASLATFSAGQRFLARSFAFRGFRSAVWGFPGGRAVELPRAAAACGPEARTPRPIAAGSVVARGAAARSGHVAADRVDRAGVGRSGAVEAARTSDAGAGGLAVLAFTRAWRAALVRSNSKGGGCWRERASLRLRQTSSRQATLVFRRPTTSPPIPPQPFPSHLRE